MSLKDHIQQLAPTTSLTAHSAGAELAIAQMETALRDRVSRPGISGARARIQKALNEAFARSQAAELDAGAPRGELAIIIAEVIGEIAAALALQATFQKPAAERVEFAVQLVELIGQATIGATMASDTMGPDSFSAFSGVATRATRA